jgi:hypothetical protein
MIGAFAAAPAPPSRAIVDPGLLTYHDRAALRILYRADVATTTQLTTLVYHRRQTAQERLARLYRAGYLERAVLPPVTRGGAPFAFRISPRGRRRLHYERLTRGRAGTQIRHSLNGVETVCALLAAQQGELDPGPVLTAWLTESMCHDTLRGVYPDGLLAVAGPTGSAIMCIEIDEATEHGPVIEDKLARYEKALWSRTWCVLFVTGSPERAARLAAIGRRLARPGLSGKAWVVLLPDLWAHGYDAPIRGLTAEPRRSVLRGLLADPKPRRCPTPVGTDAWLRLLGEGGLEFHDEALA